MTTIKVDDPRRALEDLSRLLHLDLLN